MRVYADSSFILRLITGEVDSPQVIAEYRRLGAPKLFFLPLHALEVRNAILQRAYYQRRSIATGQRAHVARERDAALARLEHLLARRALLDIAWDADAVITRAIKLSSSHAEMSGARAIDLLHVAAALTLGSEQFLTTDRRQGQIAKAEGMEVATVS